MSEAILHRHEDPSGVSGLGAVAEIFEANDGAVAIRWRGDRPSWGLWNDIRDLEAIHGHEGKSVVEYLEPHRLLAAYQLVMPWMLSARYHDRPTVCAPHPDHPDRLRCVFLDERVWRFWIALLDGSTDAASHEEVAGEMRHTWITPDGNVWLVYHTPIPGRLVASERFVVPMDDDEDPLTTFDREDR